MGLNKFIFFRNDDVWDSNAKFKKFIALFLWHKIPIHLTVIPGKMTVRCVEFLQLCLKKYPSLIEVGQHGLNHRNYAQAGKSKYEFGHKRSYVLQRKDIIKGRDLLKKVTMNRLIFTPPWHGYDQNTLKILTDLNYLGISLDRKTRYIGDQEALQNIVMNVFINKKDSSGWFVEKAGVVLGEINAVESDHVGVLTHHDTIKNEQGFEELKKFLTLLRRNSSFGFCKLSERVAWNQYIGKSHTEVEQAFGKQNGYY